MFDGFKETKKGATRNRVSAPRRGTPRQCTWSGSHGYHLSAGATLRKTYAGSRVMQKPRISCSITKSVDLSASPQLAFDFLGDFENWPKWAIVNMKSARPATDGWYPVEPDGKRQLKMLANKAGPSRSCLERPAGILDSPRADRTQRRRLHISHDVRSARCFG